MEVARSKDRIKANERGPGRDVTKGKGHLNSIKLKLNRWTYLPHGNVTSFFETPPRMRGAL